jgi:exopolyphosphatase/guanosine-5'-triphosphate,3'-diphosphate pyrophosphatase
MAGGVAGERIAVVDLGTNSTRLLVAGVEDGKLAELERRTRVTRLGQGVDATGRLAEEAMGRVFDALAEYRGVIDELGAQATVGIATSAVRDAANGDLFREALRDRYGIDARTISGDEEARLTFRGATAGRTPSDGGETLVIDIGGGSTEYVVGAPGTDPEFHVSTRMGSVRFSERYLHNDPPTGEELEAAAASVDEVIRAHVPEDVRERVVEGIAVAGTATSLAAIDQRLEPYDPDKVHGYVLTAQACEGVLNRLAALTVEERRKVPGLHPDRAPTIVAGAIILARSLVAFGLDRVEISESDILHGAALAAVDG